MKMKEMQALDNPQSREALEVFNRVIMSNVKGQVFLYNKIIDQAKWLFIVPIEIIEQLILNMEQIPQDDGDTNDTKTKCLNLLKALIPVKKHLDEAWRDMDI